MQTKVLHVYPEYIKEKLSPANVTFPHSFLVKIHEWSKRHQEIHNRKFHVTIEGGVRYFAHLKLEDKSQGLQDGDLVCVFVPTRGGIEEVRLVMSADFKGVQVELPDGNRVDYRRWGSDFCYEHEVKLVEPEIVA